MSFVADRINQWHHLVETVQQEVFGFWTAVGQNIAHDVSFLVQQWDRLLGINPNPQHQSINSTVPQHGSSSATAQAAHPAVISHAPPPSLHETPLDAPPALPPPPPPPPPPGTVYLSSSTYSVMENAGLAYIQVDLSSPAQQLVTVDFSTFDGTATAGIDYGSENNIGVNFQQGVTSQTVSVPIFDDGARDESVGSEYFNVQLTNPNGAVLGNPSSATVVIAEGSPPPPPPPGPPTVSFSSSTYSVTEGGIATITATLSSPAAQPISVQYATSDGTASSSSPDVDYNSTSGTLNFAVNSSSASFNVRTLEDNDLSNNPETVNLTLSNPIGANPGLMNATLNINEGSPPPPPPPPNIVQGIVWADSNEDGIQDAGELGKSGITVTLDNEISPGVFETYETTQTDSNGNYEFSLPSNSTGQWFQIYVTIPAGSEATIEHASGTGTTSDIDDLGYSASFSMTSQVVMNAGLVTPSLAAVLMPDQSELCDCGCPNEEGSLIQNDGNTDAPAAPPKSTPNPVRYADGVVTIAQTDLHSDGFGFPWGQTRSWTNGSLYTAGSDNGNGWVDTYTPHLIEADGYSTNTLIYIANGNTAYYYDLIGGVYQPRINDGSQLTYNSGNDTYTLTDTQGDQIVFDGFNASQTAQRGQFSSFTGSDGVTMRVNGWYSDGHIAEMQRTPLGNSSTIESWYFGYQASGVNAGLLSYVRLRTSTNGGSSWSTVRQVQYAYYDGSQSGGNPGDLMTATVEDANGNALSTSYYRYYYSGDPNGYMDALKYVVNSASYARLIAAYPGTLLSSLSDAQVAPYADNYFRYENKQVTLETVQGAGSSSSGGLGTYTFSYTPSGNTVGFNSWNMKTAVGNPDGSTDTVYTNAYGQALLDDHYDPSSGSYTSQFYLYNFNGQLVLTAAPSALSGFSDTNYDLLNNAKGYADLNSNSGLITRYDYYATTTAAETTAGGVARYLEDEQIQQGWDGTFLPQETWQYYAHSYNGQTIAPLASDTVYRNDDGSGAQTTSYAYTWYTNTAQIQSETDTAPVISAAENGPGTADVTTIYYDAYGNAQWTKDADGYLQYDAYDPLTGALVTDIVDVNTADSSEFTNLPSGWSTPSGGGLNLVSTDQVDALGRTTKETSPNGNVTYYVYLDPQHEERIYQGWNSSTGKATLPTEVIRDDSSGTYSEDLTMTATPHLTNGAPDGSEAIGNLQSLTRDYVNAAGQLTSEDAYNYLYGLTYSTGILGTVNTNYYQTTYSYDNAGRLYQTTTANGTLYQTVYNSLDEALSDWVGTSTSNFVVTASYQYDSDGNLTQETDYPGLNAANRVTDYWYDWRDRLVAEKDGVESSESDGVNRPILVTTYDNLDEAIQTQQYLGDNVTPQIVNGVLQALDPTRLRAQEDDFYDDQGRVYQTQVFDVNPYGGSVSAYALTTNSYYDHRGDLIAESDPGGLWTKSSYDGAGRDVMDYTTDGAGGTTWSAAASVTNDTVLEQEQSIYDNDGNVIETIDRQRFHNTTGTGPLGTPTSPTEAARVYYAAAYYDNVDRLIASVDAGTDGGTAWTRPGTVPSSSPTLLVTSYAYSYLATGAVRNVHDPMGIDTYYGYDNLDRLTKAIEDYTGQAETAESDVSTNYYYDGDNHVTYVQANEPGGAYQLTHYAYGVTTAGGSGVNSNDILSAIQYPDPSTGKLGSQQDKYLTDALGDVVQSTDRNGTVHQYSYDVLGRLTADKVTTLGTGVDGTVRQITYGYGSQGNLSLITSLDANSNILNQVERTFNGLGQLTDEYQSHNGEVDIPLTPAVHYAYNEMSGGQNNSRLVDMVYPDGYELFSNYNAGLDSNISRLSSLSDSTGTLESYLYLGLNTVIERDHPQSGVNLSYIKQSGDTQYNSDSGDQYTGLDRFGRIIDPFWINASNGTTVDRYQYGYNQDGDVLYRQNLVDAAMSELYQYDNLNQLTSFARGMLNSSHNGMVGTPSRSQSWSPDALGNFTSVTTNGTAQTRTANQQNEYTSISGSGTISYDADGNLTADGNGNTYVYDAWNRLVAVKNSSTGATVASYSYDGLNRLIRVMDGATLTDLYYSSSGQVVAEYSDNAWSAYNVWSPVYVNALVFRAVVNGTQTQRYYALQDANWNVTAWVLGGTVMEREVYDPFGVATPLSSSWGTQSSPLHMSFGYQGMYVDWTVGLNITLGREYSPTLMRWLQVDPIGLAAGDNYYVMEGNGPTYTVDPTGMAGVVLSGPPRLPGLDRYHVYGLLDELFASGDDYDPKDVLNWVAEQLGVDRGYVAGYVADYLTEMYAPPGATEEDILNIRAQSMRSFPQYFGGTVGEGGPAAVAAMGDMAIHTASMASVVIPGPEVLLFTKFVEAAKGLTLVKKAGKWIIKECKGGAQEAVVLSEARVKELYQEFKGARRSTPRGAGRLHDPKTGRFIPDPANPPSPYRFTDAQRRAAWKRLAEDPNSPLTKAQRAEIKARGWRGPQRFNEKTGQWETMELSHEPIPLRDGGTEVVPRWPADHAAIDPHRQLPK